MNTFKNISNEINNFVTNHAVLQSYVCKDSSFYNSTDYTYPLIWLSPVTVTPAQGQIIYTCELIIADILTENQDYDKVLSDINILLAEFLSYFDDNNSDLFNFFIRQAGAFNVFPTGIDDTCGLIGNINIITPFDFDYNNIRFK